MILGLPVIATNVGGIASQISVGENGWLVDNDEEAIYQGLKHIFENPQEVAKYKENLANYCYKNDEIIERTEQIIFGVSKRCIKIQCASGKSLLKYVQPSSPPSI